MEKDNYFAEIEAAFNAHRGKFNERLARARSTRTQNRLKSPEHSYPRELPELRRKIIVIDYDFGEPIQHEILLHRSNRIDTYKVFVDGNALPGRIGWARVLEMIRKAFIRVSISD